MAKRPLPSSAFALPGLSKPDTKKPYGLSSSRGDYFSSSSKNLSPRNEKGSVKDNLNGSSSLVDNKGSLLPPQTEHTLDNLTKTRPRSPGRRSPSPLARRKFEHDSLVREPVDSFNSSLEADNFEKASKDHKDVPNARLNALKERTTFSPALILTNDVGFSISSNEISVSPTSPRIANENRVDRPEVLPKPDRNRNRINVNDGSRKLDRVMNTTGLSDHKIEDKEIEDHNPTTMEPPPLPSSPPPLEDDVSPSVRNEMLHSEAKHSLQASTFGKLTKTADETSFDFDLSRKLGKPIGNPDEVNGFDRTKQLRDASPQDTLNHSTSSKIAKWQGYGKNQSKDSQAFGKVPKAGAGIPDRQPSLDSAIASRLSKYDTPYSSRQRKPVDKSPSARRRRFKPVTLADESEITTSENVVETPNTNPTQLAYERLHGTQAGKTSTDFLQREHDIGTQVLSSAGNVMGNSFQGNDAKQVNGSSSLTGAGRHNIEKSGQHYNSPDKFGISRTINPEPTVVLEYDGSNNAEKVIEIETNETVPFVVSDTRTSNRSKVKELKMDGNFIKSEGNDFLSGGKDDENDRLVNEQSSPGMTLPKVVIEYDGEVIKDSMVHGYDTETSSDENIKSNSSFGAKHGTFTSHGKGYESDGSQHADDNDGLFYGDYSDEEEDLDIGLDDESFEDEDLTFEDLESAREEMEKAKGIEDPELDQDDDDELILQPPVQDVAVLSESEIEETDEMLFEPPPMFASSDEAEREDLGEIHVMDNGYEVHAPSPVIPPSLLEQQPKNDKRFHNLALDVWTEEDCLDWLDYIGLGHFSTEFKEHHVDGKMLKNINFQLLEEIGIDSPDEREVILSEIYRRFHPEEEDMFEMEIQGALQSASEQEKMKIIAVLNALRSPAFQAELGLTPSTGSSSPRDSETGYHMASETGSISSSMSGGSHDHHQDLAMPPPPPPPSWSQSETMPRDHNIHETNKKGGKAKKQKKISKEKDKSGDKEAKSEKHAHKQKKHKGVSKLLESLSLGSGSSKLTKLFHHHTSSSSSSSPSKKLNPAMQYLLQSGPQGLIRIWPIALSEEMNYCSFMVNMTTTSAEIIKLVMEKYAVVDDPRRFYICETSLGKGGSHHNLSDEDCPLLNQCRWHDPDKHRFELRCTNDGVIKMLFELEGYEDDLDYRSIPLSNKTPCSEALGLIVKKFHLPGKVSEYYLVEVSEENEDDREEVADHVCPLRLQMAWSAPDHVFRLCRRATEEIKEDSKDALDGWTTDATEDISQDQGVHSDVSSGRDEDELELHGGVERDEIIEETREDLMEGLARLDSVIEEESEAIASQELENVRHELMEKEEELRDLRSRSHTVHEKELEIESLLQENEELRRRGEDLSKLHIEIENLRRENEELRRRDQDDSKVESRDGMFAEKEREVEKLRLQDEELTQLRLQNEELRKKAQEIEEKFDADITLRDREIERLYIRNNELSSKEKELESLKQRSHGLAPQEKELEKLRVLNEESNTKQSEMASLLKDLREKNKELSIEVAQAEKLKEINRELCQKVDEGEILRQELGKSEAEKKELREKIAEFERTRKESERGNTEEAEKLRKENNVLAAQCKDAGEMKKNIIKLTAQMRDMETRNQEQVNNFQKKLGEFESEKQQLLERIAELENREKTEAKTNDNAKEVEDLKLENIVLVEKTKEVEELKSAMTKLAAEVRENESFKQKYKELRDVESYLTKQVNTAETIVRQKDKKLKESENKINTLTEAVKDMEAKLEEQEQNRQYLDQLLSMLKDRDPTLLHVINSSLAQNEPEEWC